MHVAVADIVVEADPPLVPVGDLARHALRVDAGIDARGDIGIGEDVARIQVGVERGGRLDIGRGIGAALHGRGRAGRGRGGGGCGGGRRGLLRRHGQGEREPGHAQGALREAAHFWSSMP